MPLVKHQDIIVAKKLIDYSQDPFFVKKAADAKAFIKKYGLPKEFTGKKPSPKTSS